MEYDHEGHPIKPNKNQQQQPPNREYELHSGPPSAFMPSSAQHQQQQPMSGVAQSPSSPIYDENGHPIKPSRNPPQQQQQQQQAYNNNQRQQPYQGPVYDENGNPIKPQPPLPHYAAAAGGGGGNVPSYALAATAGAAGGAGLNQHHHQQNPYANINPQTNYSPSQGGGGGGYQPPAAAYNGGGSAAPYGATATSNNRGGVPATVMLPAPSINGGMPIQQRNFWTTGLCDVCSDCDVCLEVICCWWCTEGRLYDAINHNQPNSLNVGMCLLSCGTTMLSLYPIVTFMNRRSLVEKYNIQDESCPATFCFSCCCPYASSCQMMREMQNRGIYPGGQCCAKSQSAAVLRGPGGHSAMGGGGRGAY